MLLTTTPAARLRSGAAAYDGRLVLDGVDLAVAPGELVAVLGPNGSGKSTLVRSLLGLVPLIAGDVSLFGTPIGRFRSWERVGYVPQRVGAGSGVPATVREVVASGRLPRMRRLGRQRPADRTAIDEALDVVGLSGRARDSVSTLSGGQQQRVLIARALATEPELLVLDEPTSGVDAESQLALAGAMGRLTAGGVAIVLVAHELGPITPLVHRAVCLGGGRVLHDGPPAPDDDDMHDHVHGHDPEHAHPAHEPAVPRSAWGLS